MTPIPQHIHHAARIGDHSTVTLYGFGDEFHDSQHKRFLYVVVTTPSLQAAKQAVNVVRKSVRNSYHGHERQAINHRLKERDLHARHPDVHKQLLTACKDIPDLTIFYYECPKANYVHQIDVLYGRMLVCFARRWLETCPKDQGRLVLHHLEDETNRKNPPRIHAAVDQWVQDNWHGSELPVPFTLTWMSELNPDGTPLILADNFAGARRRNFRQAQPLRKNPDWETIGALISEFRWVRF